MVQTLWWWSRKKIALADSHVVKNKQSRENMHPSGDTSKLMLTIIVPIVWWCYMMLQKSLINMQTLSTILTFGTVLYLDSQHALYGSDLLPTLPMFWHREWLVSLWTAYFKRWAEFFFCNKIPYSYLKHEDIRWCLPYESIVYSDLHNVGVALLYCLVHLHIGSTVTMLLPPTEVIGLLPTALSWEVLRLTAMALCSQQTR